MDHQYVSPVERRRRVRERADALIELGSLDRMIHALEQEPQQIIDEAFNVVVDLLNQGNALYRVPRIVGSGGTPFLSPLCMALFERREHLGTMIASISYPGTLELRRANLWFYDRILKTWGCNTWAEYRAKHLRTRTRLRYESGFRRARELALERDDHKCVVTGDSEGLEVHHIDGDYKNNALINLVTLHKDVHVMISNMTEARRKHPWIRSYIEWLRTHGYSRTIAESICQVRCWHRA